MAELLDPRDKLILEMRSAGSTFEEIGRFLNLTQVRIRQIYGSMLKKLERSGRDG